MGQLALEAFWALNLTSNLDLQTFRSALRHPNPHVRFWASRLIGDRRAKGFGPELKQLAAREENVEVRQQLAATARRLSTTDALPILVELMKRDADADDVYQPLMVWWAVETHCRLAPDETVALFSDESALWNSQLVRTTILRRLVQRFAMEGKRSDLLHCATLLRNAPNSETRGELLSGFEAAFQGQAIPSLPPELTAQLAAAGGSSLALRVRQGDDQAIQEALESIREENNDHLKRIELLNLCAQLKTLLAYRRSSRTCCETKKQIPPFARRLLHRCATTRRTASPTSCWKRTRDLTTRNRLLPRTCSRHALTGPES